MLAPPSTRQLLLLTGSRAGARLDLPDSGVLGRGHDADLRVDDDSVSRRHARITVLRDSVTVEDLQSTNGTRVNGDQIWGPRDLNLGDTVEFGEISAQLVSRSWRGVASLAPPEPPPRPRASPPPPPPRPTVPTPAPPPRPEPLPSPRPEPMPNPRPPNQFTQIASTTDGAAIGALVLAVGAYIVLPFVAAIIALYMARKSKDNIAASGGTLKGGGLVTIARVLAWINIVVCVVALILVIIAFVVLSSASFGQ